MTNTRARMLVAAAALAGTGAPALAASGGNPLAFDIFQYAMAILVFVVALVILSKGAWPKITSGLAAREDKIRSEVFAAERLRKEADAAKRDFEKSIAEARAEAQRMIESTRAEQTRLAADLRAKAEIELNEMRDQARANIEAAKKAAINEIYTQAATLATAVAGKILHREVNPGDQQRLVEESMGQLAHDYARN
jgi:F-type H+-transporting ATPase subunit b